MLNEMKIKSLYGHSEIMFIIYEFLHINGIL